MPKVIQGDLVAGGTMKLAIVVSRFNEFITSRLLDAALDTFARHGGKTEQVTVTYVPGSVELALAAGKLAASKKFDAVICLGCVIRGDTSHYDLVVMQAARGISDASLASGVPCIFGVITADNLEQAIDRAGGKHGNQGSKAMLTAIEMANVMKKL